jgi:hypothetical protein
VSVAVMVVEAVSRACKPTYVPLVVLTPKVAVPAYTNPV